MAKALIFDFGNVLMHTVDYTPRHRWDDLLGVGHGTVERAVHNADSWLKAQHGQIAMADYWADVASRLHITMEQVAALAVDFYAGDALDNALVSAIRDWRADGVTTGLLSNDSVELRPKLARLGLQELFSPLIISAEIGAMKPAAPAYQAVMDALPGVLPVDIVFVDDRIENIEGARALGMTAIHYPLGANSDKLIQQLTKIVHAS